jgi:hypothetical protein
MTMRRALSTGGAMLAILTIVTGPAQAAVRSCSERLSSGPQVGPTENAARQAALADWTQRAEAAAKLRAGLARPALPNWRLATNKSVGCTRVDKGLVACIAAANPCVVQQVPGAIPDGGGGNRPPLRPLLKGKPVIEI